MTHDTKIKLKRGVYCIYILYSLKKKIEQFSINILIILYSSSVKTSVMCIAIKID